MFKIVTSLLDSIAISYVTNQSNSIINFPVRVENTLLNCSVELYEDLNRLLFYSRIGAIIPENKRMVIAELITRINYDLFNGNFEMNFDDGEIRYRTSINVDEVEISEQLIKNLIDDNILITDDYFYTIMEGITTDITPVELLEKREVKSDTSS